MKNDVNKLKSQIEFLCKNFSYYKKEHSFDLIYSLRNLTSLYSDLLNEELVYYNKIKSCHPFLIMKVYYRDIKYPKCFFNNFIYNKEFHKNFMSNIIDGLGYSLKEIFSIDNLENLASCEVDELTSFIDNKKLNSLLFNYFENNDKEALNIYQELVNDNRIFESDEIRCSYTTYDIINRLPFMVIFKDNSIFDMIAMVHEIGHIKDIYRYNNKIYDYINKSTFSEVFPMYKENRLYDYLINNNLYKNDIINSFKVNLLDCFTGCILIEKLASLNSYYLKNRRYIQNFFNYDSNADFNIFDTITYSYGFLLGTYFSENEDKIEYYTKQKYFLFNKRDLDNLGINSKDIVDSYQKKLRKYNLI